MKNVVHRILVSCFITALLFLSGCESKKADEAKIRSLKLSQVHQLIDSSGNDNGYQLLSAGDSTKSVRANLGEPDNIQSSLRQTMLGNSGEEIWYYGDYQLVFVYITYDGEKDVGYLTQVNKY